MASQEYQVILIGIVIMFDYSTHVKNVAKFYNKRANNGLYGTLAPKNNGGAKSRYVASVFDEALLPYIKGKSFETLLDFGCGTGIFSSQAANHVEKVIGVDISSDLINLAKETYKGKNNLIFQCTNGENIPMPDNSIDIALAREALCYVPDGQLPLILDEIYRVLRPEGKFVWLEQVSNNPKWQVHIDAPFLIKRAPNAIREYATSAGFSILDEKKIRTPRFPFVYLAWAGLIPMKFMPVLANKEITWHHYFRQPGKRWWDHLFILSKRK